MMDLSYMLWQSTQHMLVCLSSGYSKQKSGSSVSGGATSLW